MSESLTYSLRNTRNIVFPGNIGDENGSGSPALGNRVAHQFQALQVARHQRDVRARLGQRPGHRLAQTAAPAGDDSGPARQINLHVCLSSMPTASRSVYQAAKTAASPRPS